MRLPERSSLIKFSSKIRCPVEITCRIITFPIERRNSDWKWIIVAYLRQQREPQRPQRY